jgi:hypothetical protein
VSFDDWFSPVATAIPAILRQPAPETDSTVAAIATVAVANAVDTPDDLRGRDDRRACTECRNLTSSGYCLAAYRGEALGFDAPKTYVPAAPDLPQHCAGYLPGPEDVDRRPGAERWPSLLVKMGARGANG